MSAPSMIGVPDYDAIESVTLGYNAAEAGKTDNPDNDKIDDLPQRLGYIRGHSMWCHAFISGKRSMQPEINKLRSALRQCLDAMDKSVTIGCTDHLDCCDDGGKFWWDAKDNAYKVLMPNEPDSEKQ